LNPSEIASALELPPKYNIAPTDQIVSIHETASGE
jgi:hypothetical protein